MRLGAGGGGMRALEAERFASAVEGWGEDMLGCLAQVVEVWACDYYVVSNQAVLFSVRFKQVCPGLVECGLYV
jgi:hypothetical protein